MSQSTCWFRPVLRVFPITALFVSCAAMASAQFIEQRRGDSHRFHARGVPGAVVVLIDEPAEVTQRTRTSESGFFRIPQLLPGTYRLEVQCDGFKKSAETNLVLEGSHVRTVCPVLAVGDRVATVDQDLALCGREDQCGRPDGRGQLRTGPSLCSLRGPGSGQLFGSGSANQPSPIPAGDSIRQKVIAAGVQSTAQRMKLWT
jgi:hypothetical protein